MNLKDKYAITRKLAHQLNPDIPEDIIRKAADTRQQRFHDAQAIFLPIKSHIPILLGVIMGILASIWSRTPEGPSPDTPSE